MAGLAWPGLVWPWVAGGRRSSAPLQHGNVRKLGEGHAQRTLQPEDSAFIGGLPQGLYRTLVFGGPLRLSGRPQVRTCTGGVSSKRAQAQLVFEFSLVLSEILI